MRSSKQKFDEYMKSIKDGIVALMQFENTGSRAEFKELSRKWDRERAEAEVEVKDGQKESRSICGGNT